MRRFFVTIFFGRFAVTSDFASIIVGFDYVFIVRVRVVVRALLVLFSFSLERLTTPRSIFFHPPGGPGGGLRGAPFSARRRFGHGLPLAGVACFSRYATDPNFVKYITQVTPEYFPITFGFRVHKEVNKRPRRKRYHANDETEEDAQQNVLTQ